MHVHMDVLDVLDVLADIQELGFVEIRGGKVVAERRPLMNLYTNERWRVTIDYMVQYAKHHTEFEGEYYVCIYDGWREYSEYVPHEARTYVPWTPDMRRDFVGKGAEGEPRFRHMHANPSLYPVLPRPVLAYNRHERDANVLLIPDAQFLETQFKGFVQNVRSNDVPIERKTGDRVVWRGSPNISCGCAYMDHGFGKQHPRELAVKRLTHVLDASYERADIAWMLKHRYLLDLDGMVSAWSGLYWKLWSNSVVIKMRSHWEQWYYDSLRPYTHFVPVGTFYELVHVHAWCQKNKDLCERIAKESTQFVRGLTYDYAYKDYVIR